ncbi:aspartyl protease family protein [Danxiaibacter flavus]|uniref:Aspartyl protease family protein n=1 Tax=Danxiaibacter flavus TaxID=3049108 RepID=A0ABV3ZGS8_9BACT|nr:aspartyl protease family protein [Chitinophagaceae bacterium DXS]
MPPLPAIKLSTIPFYQITGGIIIVTAVLDDYKDSLNFVLDTGSGGISLDSTTCAYLGVKKQLSEKTVRGIAGMKTVEFAYNHTLQISNLKVDSLDFHINNYDLLSSTYGVKIDGIIGYSFLRRYIVEIDYDKFQLNVFLQGAYKYPKGGYMLRPSFGTIPIQNVYVKDNNSVDTRYYFDTGAGLCMLFCNDLVKDNELFKRKRKFYATQAEGLGGKKTMDLTVIRKVKIGPYSFKNVPVYVFDDEFNITSYPMLGGLIGNDILRRFNVTLNYAEREIHLKPNKHYTDSFDYSYSGMSVYLINGEITIADIVKGSPAEQAGLENGDILVSVENNVTGNIQQYKTMLQNAGTKLNLIIRRNGDLLTKRIKVKSVL